MKNDKADGVYVKMKIYFMGRWIKHGGFYPNYFLRVYKKTKGKMEDRWMDEHIKVDGRTIVSNIDVIESNYDRQKNIGLWTDKHNKYSTREAVEFLIQKHKLKALIPSQSFGERELKEKKMAEGKVLFPYTFISQAIPLLYSQIYI
ncbi:MAG: hypothetical protein M5T52_04140 [Ignavibacteriaceae bacterium]|nr:hypothetical protein [Ignavibacteriaceae bacterium]